ncbi:MAG: hypothetical protein JSW58_05650 [Candidatus Latescibacterota bacterium]|nr:MAG: hypothetical protein JSW58_05650 [Candidatus Latescibacterota bacterium]
MPDRNTWLHVVILLFVVASARDISAQAWVMPQGEYFFKLSGSYLSSTKEFNSEGERLEIYKEDASRIDASFRDITFTAYLEYGLTDDFTLVADIPFKILTSEETELAGPGTARKITRTNGGLGDLRVLVRAPILRRPFALSAQGGASVPMGYEQIPDNQGPPLGTGEIDGEFHLHAGLSLHPIPAYLSGGAGYRLRGGELHDEILFNVEGGYTLGSLFVKFRFEGIKNTHNPPDVFGGTVVTPIPGGGGAINNVIVGDQDIYKFLPTLSFSLTDRLAVTGELFHTFDGKNTVAGTAYAVGLIFTR